jgi:uncharacterized protein (TIGR01777 family)
MRIAIAGSSGLIGSELVTHLRSRGHEVQRIVRRTAKAPGEVTWDPSRGTIDESSLDGVDALINLAGAGVGDHRWTASYKREILNSRVSTTDLIARTAASLKIPTLVNASAIGYYGDTGSHAVDESHEPGQGFLADVVVAWERAADPAREAGVRVVHPRTGLVVSAAGGAWGRMVPLFRLGLGGRMGNGAQFWSFISMADELAALTYLVEESTFSGPVNLTAPNPATNREITNAMSRAFRRPAIAHVPSVALRLALGEFSQEVLGSSRVLPTVLSESGFTFEHPNADSAMRTLVKT